MSARHSDSGAVKFAMFQGKKHAKSRTSLQIAHQKKIRVQIQNEGMHLWSSSGQNKSGFDFTATGANLKTLVVRPIADLFRFMKVM